MRQVHKTTQLLERIVTHAAEEGGSSSLTADKCYAYIISVVSAMQGKPDALHVQVRMRVHVYLSQLQEHLMDR